MADKKTTEIRKLRKKLRQIEHLEQVDRDLTEEEYSKVITKLNIRKTLQRLISEREKEQASAVKMKKPDKTEVLPDQLEKSEQNDEATKDTSMECETNENIVSETQISSANGTSAETEITDTQKTTEEKSSVAKATSVTKATTITKATTSVTSSVVTSTKGTNHSPLRNDWMNAEFSVQFLEGHNDLVLDVDCSDILLISGSRDTTLKLWDADTGRELRSMGGHTGSVTSVKLVPYIDITLEDEELSITKAFNHMAITGSKDCSIRLWSLGDGQMRRSIYTYSSVECLDYNKKYIASGSDGGKVEVWDINTGSNIRSIKGHEDMVTCIKFQDDGRVVSGSASGVVKVWDIRDPSLRPIFDSENSDVSYKKKSIKSLATKGENIYWGNDGANIKVLEMTSGRLRKIRNHENDFGSTSAMTTTGSCLISAGYDIDKGNGYMNVHSLPEEGYLATINDNNTGCITCLSCSQVKREGQTFNKICTGGADLKLWNQISTKPKKRARSESDEGFVTAKHIRRYSENNLSDTDTSDDDDDDDDDINTYDDVDDDDDAADQSAKSWCTIS